jgi:hypothetical protein
MNKYRPHVYVIPEDDRDRQIAVGFIGHHGVQHPRIQVVPIAGGWRNVLQTFQQEYIQKLRDYPEGHVVMLIDFDGDFVNRRDEFEREIPDELKERVFVVGSRDNPEALKKSLNIGYEEIGKSLADDCDTGTTEHWDHEQLGHNASELQRLVQFVKPFLF